MAWRELCILLGVLIVWFSLMRFVLPAMGVPTCMSGACRVDHGGGCPLPGRSLSNERSDSEAADPAHTSQDAPEEEL
jgi:hypothetical protein